MSNRPSEVRRTMARVAIVLIVALTIAGLLWYGVGADERARLWQNLFDRPAGPMTFRFFLQPTMGAIAAWQAAKLDVARGHSPFLWGAITDPAERRRRLDEALIATASIILLGLVMDVIYQAIVFGTFFPFEAVLIALALGFVPYVVLRGLFARGIRAWAHRGQGPRP